MRTVLTVVQSAYAVASAWELIVAVDALQRVLLWAAAMLKTAKAGRRRLWANMMAKRM